MLSDINEIENELSDQTTTYNILNKTWVLVSINKFFIFNFLGSYNADLLQWFVCYILDIKSLRNFLEQLVLLSSGLLIFLVVNQNTDDEQGHGGGKDELKVVQLRGQNPGNKLAERINHT